MRDEVINYAPTDLEMAAGDVTRTVKSLLLAQETLQTEIRKLRVEWESTHASEAWDRNQKEWDKAEEECHSSLNRFSEAVHLSGVNMSDLDRILATKYES